MATFLFSAKAGIWELTQEEDLRLHLKKYGEEVDNWQGPKAYSFDELFELLAKTSYEREVNGK